MTSYTVTITTSFVVDTDDIDDVRKNYEFPSFSDCKSLAEEPTFLDGTFTYERTN